MENSLKQSGSEEEGREERERGAHSGEEEADEITTSQDCFAEYTPDTEANTLDHRDVCQSKEDAYPKSVASLETSIPLLDGKLPAKPSADDNEHEAATIVRQDIDDDITQRIEMLENSNIPTRNVGQNRNIASCDATTSAPRPPRREVNPGAFAVGGASDEDDSFWHNESDTNNSDEENSVPLVTAEKVADDQDRSVLLRRIEELEAQQDQPAVVSAEPLDMKKIKRRLCFGIIVIIAVALGVGFGLGIVTPADAPPTESFAPSMAESMVETLPPTRP